MMDEQIMAKLYEPLPTYKRQGGGGMSYKYVKSSDVVDRMNKVFNGQWSTRVIKSEIIEDYALVHVTVTVTDVDNRLDYSHDGYGSSPVARFNSGPKEGKVIDIGNSYKSALSTAVRNACTRFGVGLFLDADHWTEDGTGGGTPASTGGGMPSRPSTAPYKESGDIPPTFPGSAAQTEAPDALPPTTPAPPAASAVPAVPTVPPVETAPPVVNVPTTLPPKVAAPEVEAKPPAMPKIPTPSNSMPKPPSTGGASAMSATNSGPASTITDVQMAALDALLNLRDVKYEDLAQAAFAENKLSLDNIPTKEMLDYKQAVAVISYGNHLYRKQ